MLGIAACSRSVHAPATPAPLTHDGLTRLELTDVGSGTMSAYSAVERLRPFFLMTRPSAAIIHGDVPRVHVFINGYLAGDLDVLKTIPVANVESIQRVTSSMVFAPLGSEVRPGDMALMVRVR
jgi:hypothetical protein